MIRKLVKNLVVEHNNYSKCLINLLHLPISLVSIIFSFYKFIITIIKIADIIHSKTQLGF
jgi:hypothetical protein